MYVENARFYNKSNVEGVRFNTKKCMFPTSVFHDTSAHIKKAHFYGKSNVEDACFAVKLRTFDRSVLPVQTPDRAYINTSACHILHYHTILLTVYGTVI